MKLLLDFLPLLLFFASFRLAENHEEAATALANQYLGSLVSGGGISAAQAPVLLATVVVILATVAQVGLTRLSGRRVDRLLWVTLAIVVVLGGATVWLNNETFIKWKPTVYNWVLAAAMLVTQFVFRKDPLKALLGSQLELPQAVWFRLTIAYIVFFTAIGFLNLYVAFNYPTHTWVNFKVFVLTGLLVAFVIVQTFYLSRYIQDEPGEAPSERS